MDIEAAVQFGMDHGASFADARVESVEEQRLRFQDGEPKSMVAGSSTGFALRVLVDGAWGFASSDDMGPAAIRRAIESALDLARASGGGTVRLADYDEVKARVHWTPQIDPRGVSVEDKQELLRDLDKAVREHKEIRSVQASYQEAVVDKRYINSQGSDIEWGLTRTVAQVHFTAKRGDQLAGRSARVGATRGWELMSIDDPIEKARKAAKAAVDQLDARVPKGGKQTVVIDHELAGVFAHEAVGHASEADLVAMGESCFKGRMGDKLGIDGLTIHDDAVLDGGFGSQPFDDNGVPGGDRTLLRDGVLVGFLSDRERAGELGIQPNGAARAQDHHHRPLVRMSNTLIDAGEYPEEEVIGDVKEGVFCRGSRGGQVDTARGSFLFHAQDAFRIENGELVEPLRDVALNGDILTTLHNIDALGNQQKLGDPGFCGKGQWVPVCDGGPLVRIQDCLVGGS